MSLQLLIPPSHLNILQMFTTFQLGVEYVLWAMTGGRCFFVYDFEPFSRGKHRTDGFEQRAVISMKFPCATGVPI